MQFRTNAAANTMILDSSGNVGIGTSSTDISGNGTQYQGLSVIETSGSRRGFIEIGDNQNADTGGIGDLNFVGHYQDSGHTVMSQVRASAAGSTSGKRGGVLDFFTKTDNVAGTNIAMRIDSSRNVGIGLTSDISSKLHVNTEMSLGPDGNNRGIINYSSDTLSLVQDKAPQIIFLRSILLAAMLE